MDCLATATCCSSLLLQPAEVHCVQVLVWDLQAHDGGSLLQTSQSGSTAQSAPTQSPQLPATSVLQASAPDLVV